MDSCGQKTAVKVSISHLHYITSFFKKTYNVCFSVVGGIGELLWILQDWLWDDLGVWDDNWIWNDFPDVDHITTSIFSTWVWSDWAYWRDDQPMFQ